MKTFTLYQDSTKHITYTVGMYSPGKAFVV